ncbi:hypothetical protein BO99DRAFT_437059 [Aspergillus violaceofuscus CBS 115571]|uniref:Uncharacterized protein n=1 Tax=Aspergillus violaceofuscus (strain CBS 115571) TaxID=1450538 RepID=A0A2V5I530_ASPV1|nr:hypothetical protein BO99DRAFT_437059 [Aspergillus violaceofuscus CBS 115571]
MLAVSSIQKVVTIGKEEKAWEHCKMIKEIVAVVGDAAIVADSIYKIVDDPNNSVMTILNTLLLVGQCSADEYASMAAARRDISDETIKAFGPVF